MHPRDKPVSQPQLFAATLFGLRTPPSETQLNFIAFMHCYRAFVVLENLRNELPVQAVMICVNDFSATFCDVWTTFGGRQLRSSEGHSFRSFASLRLGVFALNSSFSISILRPHGWVPNLKTAQKNIESTEGWTKLLRSFSVFPVGENYRHLHDAWGASATVHKF